MKQRMIYVSLALMGCSDGATSDPGALSVLLEAEDVVTEGLSAGSGPDEVRDGWDVAFDGYVVVVGDVDLHLSTERDVAVEASEQHVVDLTAVPASGLELWSLEGLDAGSWEFGYRTPAAAPGAQRHPSVSVVDYESMVEAGLTYRVEGTITQEGGRSCPPPELADIPASAVPAGQSESGDPCYESPSVAFVIEAAAPTRFGPCEVDGVPGVTVSAGTSQTVAISIHGDHLFFNGFPEGSEGGILRLAQWLADCDLDLDGRVDRSELEAIDLSLLDAIDDRYQLGGSPVTPLGTVWDYVVAQLKTQGHFQGEGECAIDGEAHAH